MDKNIIKGFITGVWDLCHAGHLLAFKQAKEHCNYLVVGLNVTPRGYKIDKKKPIESLEERMVRLESCKYIDKIIPYYSEEESMEILKKENPDIRFLGDDWKDKEYRGYNLGIKTIFIDRSHGYSSTNLKKRIYESTKS